MTICPRCHQRYDEQVNDTGICMSCRCAPLLDVGARSPEDSLELAPPEQDADVYRVAEQLLTGDSSASPAAWQLRRELMQRTWAWPVAQRLVVDRHRRPSPGHSAQASNL